jgi:small redox-active disulfide protein 2
MREESMRIQILGPGCSKCKLLEQHAREAVAELGLEAEIDKITDIEAIMQMGVMMTPALAIDGTIKSAGRVLTRDQVVQYLKGAPIDAIASRAADSIATKKA